MKQKLAHAQVAELEASVKDVKGVKVLAVHVPGMDREQLRTMVDSLAQQVEEHGGGAGVL